MMFGEAASALDPELVGEALDVTKQFVHDGMTMLVVTHEMGFAKEVAHGVIFLDAGQMLEEGTSMQVFGNPKDERTKLS
jgi:ABC-type histidine transport system ATPase subunit